MGRSIFVTRAKSKSTFCWSTGPRKRATLYSELADQSRGMRGYSPACGVRGKRPIRCRRKRNDSERSAKASTSVHGTIGQDTFIFRLRQAIGLRNSSPSYVPKRAEQAISNDDWIQSNCFWKPVQSPKSLVALVSTVKS